jgi:hypothetical protein
MNIHIETLLNNAFLYGVLTEEEEAMIADYEYQCVMLDHAEDLESFDYWTRTNLILKEHEAMHKAVLSIRAREELQ